MSNNIFEEKEKQLTEQFEAEKQSIASIEERIKALQEEYQGKITSLARLQGAYSVLQELKAAKEQEVPQEIVAPSKE